MYVIKSKYCFFQSWEETMITFLPSDSNDPTLLLLTEEFQKNLFLHLTNCSQSRHVFFYIIFRSNPSSMFFPHPLCWLLSLFSMKEETYILFIILLIPSRLYSTLLRIYCILFSSSTDFSWTLLWFHNVLLWPYDAVFLEFLVIFSFFFCLAFCAFFIFSVTTKPSHTLLWNPSPFFVLGTSLPKLAVFLLQSGLSGFSGCCAVDISVLSCYLSSMFSVAAARPL